MAGQVQTKVCILPMSTSPVSDASQYRNHVPWIVIGICYACCMGLLLVIRSHLAAENRRRDAEPIDTTYDEVYIERISKNGEPERVKVDKVNRDPPH